MWPGLVGIVGDVGVVLLDQINSEVFALIASLVDLAAVSVTLADQGYSELVVLSTSLVDLEGAATVVLL